MQSLKNLYKIGHGPSSSHTMGPARASQTFKEEHNNVLSFKAILYGSLALTGKGHLTDKIIIDSFRPYKCEVVFDYDFKCDYHPNTFDLIAIYEDHEECMRFYSIGGGEIEPNLNNDSHKEIYKENSFNEIKEYINKNNITLYEYVFNHEEPDFKEYLNKIYDQMVLTIKNGLSKEGCLPGELKVSRKAKEIFETKLSDEKLIENKNVYSYAFATSEENASGGVIVTAPTCGSSGLLPAVLYNAENEMGFSRDKIINALAIGGLIGNIVKKNASISGAECGCQAEIGTACSMAAAAYAYLLGANIEQIERASEIALEHHLGLTCDPVLGYVQIPCIERNAVCALRAISAAKLAIFFEPANSKISFDLVVKTMHETGKDIREKYRETAQGGLAKEFGVTNEK